MKNKEVKALTALRLLQSGENPSSEDQGVSAMGVSRLSEGGENKSQVGDFTVGILLPSTVRDVMPVTEKKIGRAHV